MRKSFTAVALICLALTASLAGCGSAARTAADAGAAPKSVEYPFAPESPAIDSQPVFGGQELALQGMSVAEAPAEVRSVWISFLEYANMMTGKTERQFTANTREMFDNIKETGLNTVVVQVRPYADAIYKSNYFPWSFLVTGQEGEDPGYDPLAIMIQEARDRDLRIEAWVNPYRIRPADRTNPLSADNYARRWLEEKDGSVIEYKGVISYNPASTKAQSLIVAGVAEIVENYDVDAVHIDDYFYPTTDKEFDSASYAGYRQAGGNMSLEDWRRRNVETLVRKIYSAVKKADPAVMFGVSPQSSVYNNYHAQYLDVEKISSTPGYVDYICQAQPYAETLAAWSEMVTAPGVKLYVGLAAYKAGVADTWAGNAGRGEWQENTDLLKRMTQEARRYDNYGGIVLFRYDFIFNPPAVQASAAQKEIANLRGILK